MRTLIDVVQSWDGDRPAWLHESRANHSFENDPVVVFPKKVVYHTTGEHAALSIRKNGFRTGRDLNVAEKRGAVFFSDRDVNTGLYARNSEGEPYEGQEAVMIGADISGLPLLNMTYRVGGRFIHYDQFRDIVVRGEIEKLPDDVVGSVSFLPDGRIYEVMLPPDIATRRMV